jgi:predicted nucleic acid-binding protein
MKQKSFISDSSSLILLAKADLLGLLCRNARIFITQAISEEISFNSKDSQLIQNLIFAGEITIKKIKDSGSPASLDKGERTAVTLFREMDADYLLLDDKKAAIYCKKNSLPYINALLIPHYLRSCNAIDDRIMKEKISLLNQIGRYAKWIKEYVSKIRNVF